MKIFVEWILLFSLIFVVTTDVSAQTGEQEKTDKLSIINVVTFYPVQDGVANEFTVDLEYTLESAEEAVVAIGFNSESPGSFRMSGRKRIRKGTQLVTLKANVVPKDWKERGDFIIVANINPYPTSKGRYRPSATVTRVVEFEH